MDYYEIKVKLIIKSSETNTAVVQKAICEWLSQEQSRKNIVGITETGQPLRFFQWEPITDE